MIRSLLTGISVLLVMSNINVRSYFSGPFHSCATSNKLEKAPAASISSRSMRMVSFSCLRVLGRNMSQARRIVKMTKMIFSLSKRDESSMADLDKADKSMALHKVRMSYQTDDFDTENLSKNY